MESRERSWSKGLILICQKCSSGIEQKYLAEEGNAAENLKAYLRRKVAQDNIKSGLRVIPSGCLNVCEANKQAIAYMPCGPTQESTEIKVCHPEKDREEIYKWVMEKSKG